MNALDDTESNSEANSDQIEISLFIAGKLNSQPAKLWTIKTLIECIEKYIVKLPKWAKDPHNPALLNKENMRHVDHVARGYKLAVTFSGSYSPNRKVKSLQKPSGLICIGFKNLSPERAAYLRARLLTDIYTHILFSTPYDDGLRVVVKYNYTQPADYISYFNHLSTYYTDVYGVQPDEFLLKSNHINFLCYLPYDPNIYYRPNSQRITLPLAIVQKPNITSVQDKLGTEDKLICTESVSSNTYEAFHDERVPLNVLESTVRIEEWCKTGFGSGSEIIIHSKPDKAKAASRIISFSEIRYGKKKLVVNLEYDTLTKAIIIGDKKAAKAQTVTMSKPDLSNK